MSKRGRMMYVPPAIIDEVMDIKREDGIENGAEALRQMVKYTRLGRETNRLMHLDFSKAVNLPDINSYPFIPQKIKPKKKGDLQWL